MFPLGTTHGFRGIPSVTLLLIAANAYMFYLEMQQGEAFVLRWATIPAEVMAGRHLETVATGIFLHGDWMHIAGNMLFLWAFAPAIEEAMGLPAFLTFYLLGGLVATAAQIAGEPQSSIPLLGASGAIASVMGVFLVTYPQERIRTLVLLFPFVRVVLIPAVIWIGLWIVLQVVSVQIQAEAGVQGGVAYLAHLGGAAFGAVLGRAFERG